MSILSSASSTIPIITICAEDFYNCLYWDHRIYDLRAKDDYLNGHIWHAHNLNASSIMTIDTLADIDAQIDETYGRAEQSSKVLVYTNNEDHHNYQLQLEVLQTLIVYTNSSRNPSQQSLKEICTLVGGYEHFHHTFPFLCSDSIHFRKCSELIWPSCILSNLYLGSAMCRNETVISMLKITHVMSFSDYPEKKLPSETIQTSHWQISDSLSTDLLSILDSVVSWLSKAITEETGNVLVHCEQGVSRSASVVIAYLLRCHPELSSVKAALNYVKSKRDVVNPNISFLQQLEEYRERLM